MSNFEVKNSKHNEDIQNIISITFYWYFWAK